MGVRKAAVTLGLGAAGWMIREARSDAHRRADAVVILGARATAGRPSGTLRRRIEAAAVVLLERPELCAVASGGIGRGERVSEAAVIADELAARGVEPARVLLEERSTSTAENLAFSLPLIRQLAPGRRPRVLLATSDFHLARARLLARALGLEPLGLPASTPRRLLPRAVARELAALPKAVAMDFRRLRARRPSRW